MHPDPAQRYAPRRRVPRGGRSRLWDSWDDDAIVGDKDGGVFVDGDRIHRHRSRRARTSTSPARSRSRAPRRAARCIFQAGSSEAGKELAARYAEAIFTAQPTLEEGLAFYADIKARIRRHGRDPDAVLVLPGLAAIIGGTEAEALARQEQLEQLTAPGLRPRAARRT